VGNARSKLSAQTIAGHTAVLIDIDLVCRLVLFIYFVGLDSEDDPAADAIAAFLLLSIVVPRDEDFPRLAELLMVAARQNGRVLNDLMSIVSHFVLYHELGHAYTTQHGSAFLRMGFSIPSGVEVSPEVVQSIRFHQDGGIYNKIDLPGRENGLLLVSPEFEHWKSEFAADVFAAYANILAGTSAKPFAADLERFASALTCWQLLLFALGHRQQYMRAISGAAATADFSHPVAAARIDVLIHHINYLAEDFDPEWQSPTLSLFHAQYERLWGSDLEAMLLDGVEYVRYGFDQNGPHVNIGKVTTFTGGPVPFTGSALEKLGQYFLDPALLDAERLGWDQAVRSRSQEYVDFFNTFRVNDEPIIIQLGARLRAIHLRLISEDRA
jgi:hypothetical protein